MNVYPERWYPFCESVFIRTVRTLAPKIKQGMHSICVSSSWAGEAFSMKSPGTERKFEQISLVWWNFFLSKGSYSCFLLNVLEKMLCAAVRVLHLRMRWANHNGFGASRCHHGDAACHQNNYQCQKRRRVETLSVENYVWMVGTVPKYS